MIARKPGAPLLSAVLLLLCSAFAGCDSGRLSGEHARTIVLQQIDDPDAVVKVEGVSQGDGATEAVVQAFVMDQPVPAQLTFRLYDTGWKWEAASVGASQQESSAELVQAIRQLARSRRAAKWAEPHIEKYATTAAVIDALGSNVSRRPDVTLDDASWKALHDMTLLALRKGYNPERTSRLLPLMDPPTDGWGNKIEWVQNNTERVAYIASPGPDGAMDTTDDLFCELRGVLRWDSFHGKQMWNYPRAWRIPEGAEKAVSEFLHPKTEGGSVTPVQHTK